MNLLKSSLHQLNAQFRTTNVPPRPTSWARRLVRWASILWLSCLLLSMKAHQQRHFQPQRIRLRRKKLNENPSIILRLERHTPWRVKLMEVNRLRTRKSPKTKIKPRCTRARFKKSVYSPASNSHWPMAARTSCRQWSPAASRLRSKEYRPVRLCNHSWVVPKSNSRCSRHTIIRITRAQVKATVSSWVKRLWHAQSNRRR